MELILPSKLEHFLDEPSDSRVWVQTRYPVTAWSSEVQSQKLDEITDGLFETDTSCLEVLNYLDLLVSYILEAPELNKKTQVLLLDLLTAAMKASLKLAESRSGNTEQIQTVMKLYLLLISEMLNRGLNLNSSKAVKAVSLSLNSEAKWIWSGKSEERVVEILMEIVFSQVERGLKEEISEIIAWVEEKAKEELWEGWQARIINILFQEKDSVISPIVSILRCVPALACDLLRNLSKLALEEVQVNDTQGIKNIAAFIEKLAVGLPKELLKNISVLVSLLDCENYSLRNSVVISIGEIVCYLIKTDQSENAEKDTTTNYREQLIDILESRVLDKSSYCRSKVLDVLTKLNNQDFLPRHRFMPTLAVAVSRLHDNAVLVRKKATHLLESLIYQNKLIEPGMKIETKASIEEQIENRKEKENTLRKAVNGEITEGLETLEPEELKQAHVKEQLVVNFLEEYRDMIVLLEQGSESLKTLLKSKSSSDVTGAIDALVACSLRGVTSTFDSIVAMLGLIWNREPVVRKAVSQAFSNLYLNLKLHTEEEIIQNLVQLVSWLKPGQLTSLEDLFCELLVEQAVPPQIIKKIWSLFKTKQSYEAACILRFVSLADPTFLQRRYDNFAGSALNCSNWKVVREVLLAFERLGNQGEKTEHLLAQATQKLFELEGQGWFGVAEQLVRTISSICSHPLTLLKVVAIKALQPLIGSSASETQIAKSIFVISEIALKVVIYGDKVASTFKKQMSDIQKEDEMEEIVGGKQAQVEIELKQISYAQEKVVVNGIVGQATPLVTTLAQNLDTLKSDLLKKSVVLSLSKIMCLNEAICERNLDTLLQIAQNGSTEAIRCTGVIALGDLIMRHPNLLDSYSQHLFSKLADESLKVRKKALLVISHLVLNDMLKMKGLMANVLQCYLDKDLKSVVAIFLQELYQKDSQALFNMIPDSLSNLQKASLQHSQFKRIADLLLNYVEKERHIENLIEKLSKKFIGCEEPEALNYGYCISVLPVNEKGLRKMLDTVAYWQPKVSCDSQLETYFNNILLKCKKNWKPESKILLEEFEAGMKGEEDVVRRRKVRA